MKSFIPVFRSLVNSTDLGDILFIFVIWLLATAIETVIISTIICGLIKVFGDTDFEDSFKPTFIVVGIIEVLIAIFDFF